MHLHEMFHSILHTHTQSYMQLLKRMFSDSFPSQSGRYPVAVMMITVPPTDIDVNLEPNKTSVLLQNMVCAMILLHHFKVNLAICIQRRLLLHVKY